MEQDKNTLIGFISGILGGSGSFLLQIQANFWGTMMIAILTALLCGAAGVAGKEAYYFCKQRIKIKKRNGRVKR